MASTYRISADELARLNLRLSPRGTKVFEYLGQHLDHPTAEQIHADLLPQVPTLSKTTVYNTLHTLARAGLVREITIDDSQTHYDIVTKTHGHLRCVRCASIFDFDVDLDSLVTNGLHGFRVLEKDVYFSGVCPTCLAQVDQGE